MSLVTSVGTPPDQSISRWMLWKRASSSRLMPHSSALNLDEFHGLTNDLLVTAPSAVISKRLMRPSARYRGLSSSSASGRLRSCVRSRFSRPVLTSASTPSLWTVRSWKAEPRPAGPSLAARLTCPVESASSLWPSFHSKFSRAANARWSGCGGDCAWNKGLETACAAEELSSGPALILAFIPSSEIHQAIRPLLPPESRFWEGTRTWSSAAADAPSVPGPTSRISLVLPGWLDPVLSETSHLRKVTFLSPGESASPLAGSGAFHAS